MTSILKASRKLKLAHKRFMKGAASPGIPLKTFARMASQWHFSGAEFIPEAPRWLAGKGLPVPR